MTNDCRGRGGAGNWYTPADLALRGTVEQAGGSTNAAAAATPEPPLEHAPSLRTWQGRGGAGNYVWDKPGSGAAARAADDTAMQQDEAERAQRVEAEVQRTVEAELTKPSMAHVHLKSGDRQGTGL